jgi:hypothetical protein
VESTLIFFLLPSSTPHILPLLSLSARGAKRVVAEEVVVVAVVVVEEEVAVAVALDETFRKII